jgi:hypothetical protein
MHVSGWASPAGSAKTQMASGSESSDINGCMHDPAGNRRWTMASPQIQALLLLDG